MDELYYDFFRDFDGLVPTNHIVEWETPNNRGYSEFWVTRIVYTPNLMTKELDERPVIEFYSIANFGQFVSSYYVETLLEDWGSGLDLVGYEPHWKIEADSMDAIRTWAEEVSEPYQF